MNDEQNEKKRNKRAELAGVAEHKTPAYVERIRACLATDGSHRVVTQVIPAPRPMRPRLALQLAEEAQMELI